MGDLGLLLAPEFLRIALLAGAIAAVVSGLVGTLVVVKRLVFVSGGVSHAAFGGLGACLFLGLDPRLGAAAVAVAAALLLARAGEEAGRSHDTAIGILWAVGMAVGMVLIDLTPGYAPNLAAILFGNILAVQPSDVAWLAALALALLVAVAFGFKEIEAVAFDEDFAAVQGVPVRGVRLLLLVVVALTVVLLIQIVGILLVVALLSIPPAIGLRIARTFAGAMAAAVAAAFVTTLGGLALAYAVDLPSGPTIVLLGAALLVVVAVGRRAARPAAGSRTTTG